MVLCTMTGLGGCRLPVVSPAGEGQSVAASSDQLLAYQRSGGIAGLDDHLIIANSGATTVTRKGKTFTAQLDATQLQKLRQTLLTVHFAELNAEYLPAKQGADYLEHVILYEGHQVKTFDTATPDVLQPLLSLLSEIIKATNKPTSS